MNSSARSIQSKHAQRQAKERNSNIDHSQEDLPRRGKPLAVVQVQPVDTTETVAKPAREESTDQTVQVAEDGDGLGNNPGDNPAADAETEPEADGLPTAGVEQVRFCAQTEVDVLQANVPVDDARADNGGNGDAEGDLAHQGSRGVEGGRSHALAGVVVDDHAGGKVQTDFEALQHEKRLLEVARGFHFSDETKEGDVGAVGENNIRDGLEVLVEGAGNGCFDDAVWLGLDADGDHGDHDRAEDTDERGEGDPGHAAHGTWDG